MSSVHAVDIHAVTSGNRPHRAEPVAAVATARSIRPRWFSFEGAAETMSERVSPVWAIPEEATTMAFLEAQLDHAYAALDDLLAQISTVLLEGSEAQLKSHEDAICARRVQIDLVTGAIERLRDPEALRDDEGATIATFYSLIGMSGLLQES